MISKKVALPILVISMLSSANLALASQEGHYMMGQGEAHQGHEMEGEEHIGNRETHNEIIERDHHGGVTKTHYGYEMHGGEGDQSKQLERDKFDDGHDHGMKAGEL